MDDETLVELLAGHDPVIGDPPPQEGSSRYKTNVDNAMKLGKVDIEGGSTPIVPLRGPSPERRGLGVWKIIAAVVAIQVGAVAMLNVVKYADPDRQSVVGSPGDTLPQKPTDTSNAEPGGIDDGEITSVVLTKTTTVRQFPDETISDQSAEIILSGDDYEFSVEGQSVSIQVDDTLYERQDDPAGRYIATSDVSSFLTVDRDSLSVVPLREHFAQKPDFVSDPSVDGFETFTVSASREEYPGLLGIDAGAEQLSPLAMAVLLEDDNGGDLTPDQLPENLQLSVTSSGGVVTEITVVVQGTNADGPVDMTFTTTFGRFNAAPDIVAPEPEQIIDEPADLDSSTEPSVDLPTS